MAKQLALFAPAPTAPVYFASGSNHEGEILGLADVGHALGVAIDRVNERAMQALESVAGTGLAVFADSGAFSEVDFSEGAPRIAKAITAAEWDKRLSAMERLAAALGSQLYPVAPDCVGFQVTTLERLTRYQLRVRRLMALGANVIVPLQKGATAIPEFYDRVVEVLGSSDFVCGIPMKKDATSTEDLAGFLAARRPARVHLLGLGPRSRRWAEVMAVFAEHAPECVVTCDSVLIRTMVGRSNGRGGGPRPLTAAADRVEAAARQREGEEGLSFVAWRKRLAIRAVLGSETAARKAA